MDWIQKKNFILPAGALQTFTLNYFAPKGGKNRYDFSHLWKIAWPMGLLLIKERRFLFGSWVCSEWISVLLYYIRLRYADLYNTAASFCMARVMFCLMKTSFHISCFDERKYNRYSSYVLGPSVLSGPESFCIYSLSKVNPRCAIRSKGLTRTNMMEEIYLFKERLVNTI